ncbi:cwf21-domain-containing protein [Hesseltinella vesiculosa]|uniref:Cwf21-domain-containing protein n=1 Tax=Hesseltinella vesiculosa TaxID=101127 RepID=A0A1X2G373_9FUNG|nr:cwf21-domain-containing protein [Hesseltinella vesiculosa]
MYNGIGLSTPRGSGTNGYVVRNLSHVKTMSKKIQENQDGKQYKSRPPNKDITQHDLKRKIEVECMELQLKLEEEGLSQEEIDLKVDAMRQAKLKTLDEAKPRDAKSLQEHETHLIQEAKKLENQKLARAFRIKENHVEGAAFDRDLQRQRREKRRIERDDELRRQQPRQRRNTRD